MSRDSQMRISEYRFCKQYRNTGEERNTVNSSGDSVLPRDCKKVRSSLRTATIVFNKELLSTR